MILPPSCDIGYLIAGMGLNGRQTATTHRLYESLSRTAIQQSAYNLGGSGLLASSYIQDNLSPSLPSNQWELEVQNWVATSLTALQLSTVQYVTGYGSPAFDKYVTPPHQRDRWMCTNQIVRRDDFASFSVLGLAIILGICGLIILLSETLSRIVPLISGKSPTKQRIDMEWRAYDILELQCRNASAATAVANAPGSVKVPRTIPQPTSLRELLSKWLMPWRLFRRKRSHPPGSQTVQNESPFSSTDFLPHDRKLSWTSEDTAVASPTSPQNAVICEKV